MKGGSALHAGLNVLYTQDWDFKTACAAMEEEWAGFVPPLGGKHSYMTLFHLQNVLGRYMDDREENSTQLEECEVLTNVAERAITVNWEGLDIGGMPDLPVRFTNGQRFVVDHKCTASWVNDFWALKFKLGHQVRVYAGMLEVLTGESFDGGYINAIHMGPKGVDPPEAWEKRKSAQNMLIRIDFTPAQMVETWEWIHARQQEIELWTHLDIWPQNEQACGDYGGCEFIDLCKVGGKLARKAIASQQFTKKEPSGLLLSGADE
jgi:hypothetical protein